MSRKPKNYKLMLQEIKEQFEDSDYTLIETNYLGIFTDEHKGKEYKFLTLSKFEPNGQLILWLDTYTPKFGHDSSESFLLEELESILKVYNFDTLKVLYGK